jgi:hypothetical protein
MSEAKLEDKAVRARTHDDREAILPPRHGIGASQNAKVYGALHGKLARIVRVANRQVKRRNRVDWEVPQEAGGFEYAALDVARGPKQPDCHAAF